MEGEEEEEESYFNLVLKPYMISKFLSICSFFFIILLYKNMSVCQSKNITLIFGIGLLLSFFLAMVMLRRLRFVKRKYIIATDNCNIPDLHFTIGFFGIFSFLGAPALFYFYHFFLHPSTNYNTMQ
jgi:hypothetical protein